MTNTFYLRGILDEIADELEIDADELDPEKVKLITMDGEGIIALKFVVDGFILTYVRQDIWEQYGWNVC